MVSTESSSSAPCYLARAMSADPVFFRDLALVLLAAVIGGALAWLARQPLVLGYVLGGMVISPFTPGPTVSGGLHTSRRSPRSASSS